MAKGNGTTRSVGNGAASASRSVTQTPSRAIEELKSSTLFRKVDRLADEISGYANTNLRTAQRGMERFDSNYARLREQVRELSDVDRTRALEAVKELRDKADRNWRRIINTII